jgi:membrane fusion protein (multidrug efflux system)
LIHDSALAQGKGRAVTVEAVTLEPVALVETVNSVGNFIANEDVVIRPEIDGRVVEIAFDEGQPVKKDQLLFRLDAAVYQAQLAEAQARLALSKRIHERARALNQKGHASAESLDRTLAEMRIDQATVELNKARLDKTRIVAPFDGYAGLRRVSVGDFVEAKNDLVALVSLDPIKVEFRLPERYYRVLGDGGSIRAEPDALPGERFEGEIYAISPTIDLNGRAVEVKARVANPGKRLRPGMFARVTLIVERRNDALVLPEAAIIQRGDGQFVFRVRDGKAALAQVRLGLRQTGRVEVVSGLDRGDLVVTAGQIKLREGTEVTVADFGAGETATQ